MNSADDNSGTIDNNMRQSGLQNFAVTVGALDDLPITLRSSNNDDEGSFVKIKEGGKGLGSDEKIQNELLHKLNEQSQMEGRREGNIQGISRVSIT